MTEIVQVDRWIESLKSRAEGVRLNEQTACTRPEENFGGHNGLVKAWWEVMRHLVVQEDSSEANTQYSGSGYETKKKGTYSRPFAMNRISLEFEVRKNGIHESPVHRRRFRLV